MAEPTADAEPEAAADPYYGYRRGYGGYYGGYRRGYYGWGKKKRSADPYYGYGYRRGYYGYGGYRGRYWG